MLQATAETANAKYHYSYYFFYKINKGDLPFMDCCVFWCELTNLVGFCGCFSEVKAAEKNSRRSGPCLREGGLRPENPSNSRFFRPEANFYYRCTAENV